MDKKVRIQKVMSEAGVCSRRKAEEYIRAGRVKVDGRPASIGMKIDPSSQIISFDGKVVEVNNKKPPIYIAMNKPRGYITSMQDQFDRKDIRDLTKDFTDRLFPVGRLDMDSEGLLILTNDGIFANKIAHPKYEIEKTYRVTTIANVPPQAVLNLAEGVLIDGEMTQPANVEISFEDKNRTVLIITISEGKNRQVRRMFEEQKLEVKRLKRTEIGEIRLGVLQPGEYRYLTKKEVANLLGIAKYNYKNKTED